jgi:hypothetical protein
MSLVKAESSSVSEAQKSIMDYLDKVLGLFGNPKIHPFTKLKEQGRWWTPSFVLPARLGYGKEKECFKNAFNLAVEHPHLTYVEGYACREIGRGFYFPTLHAWVVDEKGVVIDPTWRPYGDDRDKNAAFFGIAYATKDLLLQTLKSGIYSSMLFKSTLITPTKHGSINTQHPRREK